MNKKDMLKNQAKLMKLQKVAMDKANKQMLEWHRKHAKTNVKLPVALALTTGLLAGVVIGKVLAKKTVEKKDPWEEKFPDGKDEGRS